MNEQKLKELALDGIFWSMAHDNVGIYPKSVIGGDNPYEKRSERMEGWNEAGTALLDHYAALEQWHASIPDEFRELVTDLLLEKKIEISVREKECALYVNCSDTFYWGCSDAEEITFNELAELKECWSLSTHGGELWCARKRGMRPQTASYKECYPKTEWPLFDACGPERTDPDGRGSRE
jgi:hypothetical protein